MAVNLLGFHLFSIFALALTGVATAQQAPVPPNMDFEAAPSADAPLPGWIPAHGTYRQSRDTVRPFAGAASARVEAVAPPADNEFGTISRAINAAPYRGKRVRLRASVRTDAPSGAWAGLWLRADKQGGGIGFFDNMADRPITDPAWRSYEIVGDIPADADKLLFGLLLVGGGKAWLDDVSLTVIGDAAPASEARTGARGIVAAAGPPRAAAVPGDVPAGPLKGRGLVNLTAFALAYGHVAHFDATDAAAAADWPRVAIEAVPSVEAARSPRALADALNAAIQPYAPDFCAYPSGSPPPCGAARPASAKGAMAWRHLGRELGYKGLYKSQRMPKAEVSPAEVLTVDLGGGVSALAPIAAWVDAEGHTLARPVRTPPASTKPADWKPAGFDRSTRIADVIVAWNLFQHFYPYFDVVEADWPKVLRDSLARAAQDPDDLAFADTLRTMVAALRDGHGSVTYARPPEGRLPLAWDWIEGRLVVTATASDGVGLRPGDVIERIDGAPVAARIAAEMAKQSGSDQWRRVRALDILRRGAPGRQAVLAYVRPGGGGEARMAFGMRPVPEPRPSTLAEIRPGIVYVDLSRFTPEQLEAGLPKLAAAKGIVFDLRGYPNGKPGFLSHLSGARFRSVPMRIPVVTAPDRQGWTYEERGWDMPATAPRFTGNVVFLADARAISYAESILGTVKGAHLARIVGSPTAGANGNVNPLALPGGYVVNWTGMQVLSPERGTHHGIGILPDVPATRTIEGVRAGRDEVLEKGLELLGAEQ